MLFQRIEKSTWYTSEAKIGNSSYKIEMLRSDIPSDFGIAEGRIIKLFIYDGSDELLWYDRGWVKLPNHHNAEAQKIYEEIINEWN